VEADVYVWRYALLVVHARKEEDQGLYKFYYFLHPNVLVIMQNFFYKQSAELTASGYCQLEVI